MYKINTLSICLILFSFSVCYSQSTYPKENHFEVSIIEKFVIGNDASLPIENSLGNPESVFTDSAGNIYIADKEALKIRVFKNSGNYLQSLGQRGRGPGEFLSMGFVFLNNEKEIFAADPMQFRITKFNVNGEVLDTYSTSPESQDINFFRQVFSIKNDEYLAIYRQTGAGKYAKYASDHLFHVWDSTFQNKKRASGSFQKLGYTDPYGKRFASTKPGNAVLLSNDNLLLAPFLYKGMVFKFTKDKSEWTLEKKLEGYQTSQPASVTLDENDPKARISHSYGKETIAGRVNILSSGIFELNGNYITHFSIRRDQENEDENWVFGVELFDIKQNFLGYYPLKTLNDVFSTSDPLVQWKDEQGRFYMLDQEEGIPVVRVFTLDIQKK